MTTRVYGGGVLWWRPTPLPGALIILLLAVTVVSATRGQSETGGQEERRLIDALKDGQVQDLEPERLEKAIRRLGEIKSVAAIDSLVQLLTFRSPTQKDTSDHMTTPLGRYPAAGALYSIGKPALPALVKVIETSEANSLQTNNAVFAQLNIFNDNRGEGLLYLQQAAEKASSNEATQRLMDAADLVKKHIYSGGPSSKRGHAFR